MRFLIATLATFVLSSVADADDLTLNGDLSSIEVERQIIVKEKLALVKKLPFTLQAPAGGFGYQWQVPSNVKFTKKENTIEVTEGRGLVTVGLEWVEIDFEAKKVTPKSAKLAFVIIDLKPPTPPDPLTQELKALYQADPALDKALQIDKLIAVFRVASTAAINNQDVKTAAQLADAVRGISRSMLPADALQAIRKRIGEVIAASLPNNPDEPLTTATRQKAAEVYQRIAAALEAVTW